MADKKPIGIEEGWSTMQVSENPIMAPVIRGASNKPSICPHVTNQERHRQAHPHPGSSN